MATSPIIEQSATTGDIAVIVAQKPTLVLVDKAKRDDLFAHIKREISAFEPDVSTAKGRDAIKSFAFKITRTKTAIDDAGKKLNEDARAKIAVVDAARRDARETLDEMAKAVRKPLTEWEEAEKARLDRCNGIISDIHGAAIVTLEDTSETVRERGMKIWAIEIGEEFGALSHDAEQAKSATIATLQAALARLKKEEAERAELEKLRAEAAARAEADRIAAEQAEAERVESARIEAERVAAEQAKAEAEQRRIAAEEAEAARIEQARADAAAAVQREAEEKAAAIERKRSYARQIIAHIQQVGLGMIDGKGYPYGILLRELTDKIVIDDDLGDMQDEVRAIRDATLANVQSAMERAQERAAQQEREEQERIALEEQAKRDADQKHRTAVMRAAKEAIMTCGADEETARKIVMLIRAGDVPHVTLRF